MHCKKKWQLHCGGELKRLNAVEGPDLAVRIVRVAIFEEARVLDTVRIAGSQSALTLHKGHYL